MNIPALAAYVISQNKGAGGRGGDNEPPKDRDPFGQMAAVTLVAFMLAIIAAIAGPCIHN